MGGMKPVCIQLLFGKLTSGARNDNSVLPQNPSDPRVFDDGITEEEWNVTILMTDAVPNNDRVSWLEITLPKSQSSLP
jgi:hypothetical protein